MTVLVQNNHPTTICPQKGCGGKSQVEQTRKRETWYVRRIRVCEKCNHHWTTAEVPLQMIQRTIKLDAFLKSMK